MNYKRIIFITFFLVVFGFLFNFNVPIAKAMTASEIQALIARLQAQIAELQQQLAKIEGAAPQWCHDFNVNLKIGMGGSDVEALHIALEKEGFSISQDEKSNKEFDESIASSVTGFQEKYKDEILTPLGLKYGTGYAGKATRAKLNELYGCGVKPPTLPPTTPCGSCPQLAPIEPGLEDKLRKECEAKEGKWGAIADKCGCYGTPQCVMPSVCIQIITPAKNPLTGDCKNFPTPCDVPTGWEKVGSCPAPICGVFITCEKGYTSYDTNEKDNQGCPIKKCVLMPTTGTGTGVHRFEALDSGFCTCTTGPSGSVCTPCPPKPEYTIYNAKVSVYDVNGKYIGTKDTSSGMAVFENLPYGNYTYTISAEGYETYSNLQFIVCAACGDTSSVSLKKISTTIPSITVLSPNGGETWTFGNTYGITWKSSGVKTASVYLWFSDGTTCKLADVPAENGKYSVQFAENQLCTTQNISIKITTGRYQIKIYTENEKANDSSDNYFSIVSATPISTTPIITVTYPNGGEIWTKGSSYTVKWSVSGSFTQGSKRLILEKSGTSVLQYVGKAENADLFNLSLSSDLVSGNDYKIKMELVDTSNAVIASDTSDNYFNIVSAAPSSITVLSPNGGEKWTAGQTYAVTWSSSGVNKLAICVNYETNCMVLSGIPNLGIDASLGKFSWFIDPNVPYVPGSNLKIEIYEYEPGKVGARDQSDNYFSIVEGTTGLKNIENQLADISKAVFGLLEEIGKLLGR